MTVASGTCGEDLTWTLNDDYSLVIEGSGAMTDYVALSGTSPPWYDYREQIISISLPEGLTHIGSETFFYCIATSGTLTIPSTVTSIGKGAFSTCGYTSLILPLGLITIDAGAFDYNFKFTGKLVIPPTVTSIGKGAFTATQFTSVDIPASVTEIGNGAFSACFKITKICIEDVPNTIGNNAFSLGDNNNPVVCTVISPDNIANGALESYKGSYTTFSYAAAVTYERLTYDSKKIQVESAIRDGDGVKISTNYAKKSDVSVQFTDVSVEFILQSTPDYEDYPYRGSFASSMITANTYASVTYSDEQATSLNFAPFCDTAAGALYIYSRTDVGTQTIPTINLGGGPAEIAIDSTPTSGSGNAVSSGGVYTNCVRTTGDQYVDGVKAFTGSLIVEKVMPDVYLDNTSDDYTQANTSVDTLNFIGFRDKNNNDTFHISEYKFNGGRGLAMTLSNKASGAVDTSEIILINPDSGSSYATAPYRAYNSANTADIMTIGMYNALTTGTGTVASGCSLIDGVTIKWYKKGNICTVLFPITASSSYTGLYTQYILATGLPASVIEEYPFGSSAISIDGQNDNGGARAFVNTYGHLYVLVRNQSIAGKGLVGSVTYITA